MTDSTIEALTAQRDAERARADAAEQMVAELRASLNDADDIIRDYAPGFEVWIDHASAVLARTESVAGRWVPATEVTAAFDRGTASMMPALEDRARIVEEVAKQRDALRAEVEELREALAELRVDLAGLTHERR